MVNYPLVLTVDADGNNILTQAGTDSVPVVANVIKSTAGVTLLDNEVFTVPVEGTNYAAVAGAFTQEDVVTNFAMIANNTGTAQTGSLNLTTGAATTCHNLSGCVNVSGNLVVSGDASATGAVAVGTSAVDSKAALDVQSTTKAFLPPRMTTAQRNAISSPAKGSVIYNTTTNLLNHYNGSAWLAVGAVASGASETVAFYDALGGTQTVVILNGLIVSWTAS